MYWYQAGKAPVSTHQGKVSPARIAPVRMTRHGKLARCSGLQGFQQSVLPSWQCLEKEVL